MVQNGMQGNTLGLPQTEQLLEMIHTWQPDPALYIGASVMPDRGLQAHQFMWDVEDHQGGMTAATSLDSDPTLITGHGFKRQLAEALYFMEGFRLNQSDLLLVRSQDGAPVIEGGQPNYQRAGTQLVEQRMAALNRRLYSRKEWARWQALLGSMTIDENGVKVTETWTVQTATASPLWSSTATSDPLATIMGLYANYRHTGATLSGAKAYMNWNTAQNVVNSQAIRDLFTNDLRALSLLDTGQFVDLLASIARVNFVVYDEGYLDSSNVFQPFIPDNKVVVVGRITLGDPLGFLASVPSLQNGGVANPQSGPFVVVEDEVSNNKNPFYAAYLGEFFVPVLQHPEYVTVLSV